MAKLILMFKDQVLKEFPFLKESMTIGRKPDNDIQIDNLAVSSRHAKIDRSGSDFILNDLQSTNGTFVNDKKVASHKLKDGDKIIVGKHILVYVASETDQTEENDVGQTMVLDTAKQRELLGKQKSETGQKVERIGVLSPIGKAEMEDIKLTKKLTRIGKARNAEVRLSGLFMGATAATISKRPSGYTITFTGGMTKLKVNGQVVKESAELKDHDKIELGAHRFQFYQRKADSL
jgi:pSer/pThr/pTyr-binding forkhead associated (FHA) protein